MHTTLDYDIRLFFDIDKFDKKILSLLIHVCMPLIQLKLAVDYVVIVYTNYYIKDWPFNLLYVYMSLVL